MQPLSTDGVWPIVFRRSICTVRVRCYHGDCVLIGVCVIFCRQIRKFENLETDEERIKAGKEIYDQFIMKELLSQSHVSTTLFSSRWNLPVLMEYRFCAFFRRLMLANASA